MNRRRFRSDGFSEGNQKMLKTHAMLPIMIAVTCPAMAQDSGSAAVVEAGKLIYERTDNNGGCIRCHGPNGMGSEVNIRYSGNNIQGKTAQQTRIAIMALPMMWNVTISDEELDQVAAYLAFLHNSAD